ncbi:hypothetical protein MHYP_G00279720 [Metynnis hypsauchen]
MVIRQWNSHSLGLAMLEEDQKSKLLRVSSSSLNLRSESDAMVLCTLTFVTVLGAFGPLKEAETRPHARKRAHTNTAHAGPRARKARGGCASLAAANNSAEDKKPISPKTHLREGERSSHAQISVEPRRLLQALT